MRYNKIAIIGLGYVGLPLLKHIIRFSDEDFVVGFDIDELKVASLNSGKSYINDISDSDIDILLKSGRVEFTCDESKLTSSEVFVVCVPTPIDSDKIPNLEYLRAAVRTIKTVAMEGSLIINESTSYPGTLRESFVEQIKKERELENFYFVTAPERINPGGSMPIEDITRVIGGINEESTRIAVGFYQRYFKHTFPVQTPEIAEMSKLLENTFRQVNISLINEINNLCRKVGIDTLKVIEAASTKPYGFMPFFPSAGIGGHCIPVDPEYLQDFSRKTGMSLKMIESASIVNQSMGKAIYERVMSFLPLGNRKKGLIIGVAYKSNIGDVRDTPAKNVIEEFRRMGLEMNWHDPMVSYWQEEESDSLANNHWDFGLILTFHDLLDIKLLKSKCRILFDTTGTYVNDSTIEQI